MIKVVRRISDILLVIIIIILLGYFALRMTKKIEIYCIMTGSMEENIHAGDYILIVKNEHYEVGDVVTFKKDNAFITHRIIREEGNNFITKGDANNAEDDKIEKNDVVGKVILSGGILNFIVNYKYALAGSLIALYLLEWIIIDIIKMVKEKKNNQEEIE